MGYAGVVPQGRKTISKQCLKGAKGKIRYEAEVGEELVMPSTELGQSLVQGYPNHEIKRRGNLYNVDN